MLELAHSNVEKGSFELRLEGEGPAYGRWILALGELRARLFALGFILIAVYLTFTQSLAEQFFAMGWVDRPEQAFAAQNTVKWMIAALGGAFWFAVYSIRRESLTLLFDRAKNVLNYRYLPQFTLAADDEGQVPFKKVKKVEVYSPEREPKTPFGFIELLVEDEQEKAEKTFRFKVLSEEQFRFYPLNIARITGREPTGDYVEEE